MIIRENTLKVQDVYGDLSLSQENKDLKPEKMIFFDLEHYVYKKPKCIGVFGACVFNNQTNTLEVTQYMIENKNEAIDILVLAYSYFVKMKKEGKDTIVTFSGNNDFSVINYLFKENNIEYDFDKEYNSLDIQKEYEKRRKKSIGLKNLEKQFNIVRETEVISGSNLAKTFQKVMKDKDYISRMPREKIDKILFYNEQDVVNLYHIFVNWEEYIEIEYEPIKIEQEEIIIDEQ